MKKPILLILLLLLAVTASAQKFRDAIKLNPTLSASNYRAYPEPKATLTPTPRGYTPCYISHYGRHGSRFLIDPKEYSRPIAVLAHADSMGILSGEGHYALEAARQMSAEAFNRYGELTKLGAWQHQQIARRMITRFPEVFADSATVTARSTVVIRCILSMENEMQELLRANPTLKIDCDASESDMTCLNNWRDTMVERLRKNPALKKTCDDWVRQHVDNRPLMHRLFTNAEYADTISNYNQTAEDLFHLATIAQNSAVGERINLYKLFTTDELYHLWQQTNIWWYLYYGASALSNGQMTWAEKPLVKDIVAKADSCLLLRHPGATMRFGHESVVLPLVCLLDINGYGVQTSNVDSLESYGWIGSEIFPMASNVQFIFYKPTTAGANNILVKVLLNEEEATLPLKPAEGLTLPDAPKNAPNPYYKWTDVRNYLVGIIKRQ